MRLTKYLNLFIYLFLYRLLCELCLFFLANASIAIVSPNINFILILNRTKFKDWKENVLIVLCCMDLDLALELINLHLSLWIALLKQKRNLRGEIIQIA